MSKQFQLTSEQLLNARNLPFVLYAQEAGFYLRKSPEDLHYLAKRKMIKELGNPKPNAPKYYFTKEIMAKKDDADWQNKAIKLLTQKNREKNQIYREKKKPNNLIS